jgi:hypothetical protein
MYKYALLIHYEKIKIFIGGFMKRIGVVLCASLVVLVGNLSAMEPAPTSQGRYKVDYAKRAERYMEELRNANEITAAMRERGRDIKAALGAQGHMDLVQAINEAEQAIEPDIRGAGGTARRRLDF